MAKVYNKKVSEECKIKKGSGFRDQINLYWQKRNVQRLKWRKLHDQNNSNK